MKRARKPSDIVQYKLRIPAHLHARLEKAAAKFGRTLNDELVRRLGESFEWEAREAQRDQRLDSLTERTSENVKSIEAIVQRLAQRKAGQS